MAHPYQKEVETIVERLVAHGCGLEYKRHELIEHILSTDDTVVKVTTPPDHKTRMIRIILGNGPGEAMADYTCCDVLDKVSNEVEDAMEAYVNEIRAGYDNDVADIARIMIDPYTTSTARLRRIARVINNVDKTYWHL